MGAKAQPKTGGRKAETGRAHRIGLPYAVSVKHHNPCP
jgi:hypothetical protein